jgi:uroporphyrin-III C-methyltransferase
MATGRINPNAASDVAGKVYLVGVGPGDIELLTLKAVRALGEADVALVDDLVNREVLRFLRPGARVIGVGKRGGCRSTPQRFIERQMVVLAQRGLCVVRVKGGDPFVFGRGGEELEAIRAANIEVEVVGGITAGIGVPASIGIPVTHRRYSRGVTFVTGHSHARGALNWQALVACGTTLVIYMGVSRLEEIVANLLNAGMAPTMPVAVIQNGTMSNATSTIAPLTEIVTAVELACVASPALIVVGEVVRLAETRHDLRHTWALFNGNTYDWPKAPSRKCLTPVAPHIHERARRRLG